jgi:hypothetical protein
LQKFSAFVTNLYIFKILKHITPLKSETVPQWPQAQRLPRIDKNLVTRCVSRISNAVGFIPLFDAIAGSLSIPTLGVGLGHVYDVGKQNSRNRSD